MYSQRKKNRTFVIKAYYHLSCHYDGGRNQQPEVPAGCDQQYHENTDGHKKTEQVGIPEEAFQVAGCVTKLSRRGDWQAIKLSPLVSEGMYVLYTDSFMGKFIDDGQGVCPVR